MSSGMIVQVHVASIVSVAASDNYNGRTLLLAYCSRCVAQYISAVIANNNLSQ